MQEPSLSVIIPSVNGLPFIDECLSAQQRQKGNVRAEVIVADRCKNGTAEHIRKKFPHVKVLEFSDPVSIPELRAMAMSHTKGDIIAITEDHCIAQEDWYLEILKAHESGYEVVGGAVENGSTQRLIDWAVYFCEYSNMMLPIAHGVTDGIAGNNASYKREVLERVSQSIKRNFWEFFLHQELQKMGVKFLSVPTIVVFHKREFGFRYFLAQRFHYSRSFASMRQTRISGLKYILLIFSTPLLPGLMFYRITRQILSKKRHYKEFLFSFPFLTAFLLSYAAGELVGYLFGPGNSLVKVE